MGGGFFGGNKGEGRIQNVENYGLEVPAKTTDLYLVPKLRNLIFWNFGGLCGRLGGIFLVMKVLFFQFWGGDKGEGSIQNVENYGIEVPAKTAGLYLVPKQRNLIFWDFGGFGFFWEGFWGNFWVYQRYGEYSEQGEQMGLRSLWKPKDSINSQSWGIWF